MLFNVVTLGDERKRHVEFMIEGVKVDDRHVLVA